MTTRGYSQLTLALLQQLDSDGPHQADETIAQFLGEQSSEAYVWPDDHLLEEMFLSLRLYPLLTRARLRIVLEGIEEQLRTGKAESSRPSSNLTIEHVMPQDWYVHWPLDADSSEEEEAAARRSQLVQSIGNLTLVTQRLNSAISNGPWSGKRDALSKHSVLYLNKDLLERSNGGWDEDAIEERGRRLAGAAATLWPTADAFGSDRSPTARVKKRRPSRRPRPAARRRRRGA